MDKATRRAAAAAYKERPAKAGVYVVRCGDGAWVGATPTLDTVENRIRSGLRFGGHPNKALQAAFRAHGESELSFEALETAPDDLSDLGRRSWLAERAKHWRESLTAQAD